jgi:nicotinamidase-related amidase
MTYKQLPLSSSPVRAYLYCFVAFLTVLPTVHGEPMELQSRHRVESSPGSGKFEIEQKQLRWKGSETAIIICDMWDRHWCKGATARVTEMAPRMNEVIRAARQRGVFIIHCPSGTMDFYKGTPQRKLARAAPVVRPKIPLQSWCSLDPKLEAPLPIDDSDHGCDDLPRCKPGGTVRRQIAALEIAAGDAITDSAEAYYLLRQRGIVNVIVMGVHTNMCVLGRPFSIRQMVRQGLNVVLMRDLTDTMYNSRRAPYVSHFAGTNLVVEHIEKYWCSSITSSDIVGGGALPIPG